jgi:1-deoxy-D-xylulose-5-phosphate synthase
VVAIYSSFLQRAYDQILHDVCVQNLHVVFAIDRAGLVGKDGVTHQGVFDVSFLSTMPNMTIMAPKNKYELSDMMKFAVDYNGPIALRYPRGEAIVAYKNYRKEIEFGKAEPLEEEGDILLFAFGSMVDTAMKVRQRFLEKGISIAVCNARFAKPLDEEYLKTACLKYKAIVTMEENALCGGFGASVLCVLNRFGYRGIVERVGIPDKFIQHGAVDVLKEHLGIDVHGVEKTVESILNRI